MVHLYSTHTPYDPPQWARELYCDPKYAGPIRAFYSDYRGLIERGQYEPTPADLQQIRDLYYGGVSHADRMIGGLLDELRAQGVLDQTLVIVTADHGESLAQRDNWGHGGPWQEGVRVPLIVRLPGNERAGERLEPPVHLVDIVTTVLAFAGLPGDPALPGCSLLAPLSAERVVAGGQDPVHYLVRWPRKVTRAGERVGWFDLASDPGEKNPQRASVAEFEALRAALQLDPASFHPPLAAATLSPAAKAELEALGYAGEVDGE
jgi:arylsulfatase A-like enzyme